MPNFLSLVSGVLLSGVSCQQLNSWAQSCNNYTPHNLGNTDRSMSLRERQQSLVSVYSWSCIAFRQRPLPFWDSRKNARQQEPFNREDRSHHHASPVLTDMISDAQLRSPAPLSAQRLRSSASINDRDRAHAALRRAIDRVTNLPQTPIRPFWAVLCNTVHLTPDITEIFCDVDDFCQVFEPLLNQMLLPEVSGQKLPKSRLTLSEIMTILIGFHGSRYRTFKDFTICK